MPQQTLTGQVEILSKRELASATWSHRDYLAMPLGVEGVPLHFITTAVSMPTSCCC